MTRFEPFQEPPRALEGLKVVELPCLDTMPFLAASMAAKSFADFGAEVVKVEPPRTGSMERSLGPFRDEMPDPETGGLHVYLNTNKLGVTIDLENRRGRELALDLLAPADIVFNPNRPEVNEKLGIDWRTLTARFPKLIVVSITFFGAESPYRNLFGARSSRSSRRERDRRNARWGRFAMRCPTPKPAGCISTSTPTSSA